MLSIGAGMSQNVEAQMSGLGADILTVSPGYTQAEGSAGGFKGMRGGMFETTDDDDSTLTDKDIYAISATEGVLVVNGIISGQAEVEFLSESVTLSIEGIDPVAWNEMTTSELESGRFLSQGDSNSVLIGSSAAYEMFDQALTVNTQIKIEGKTFKIVGILKESGTGPFGDDYSIIMTQDAARDIVDDINSDEYSEIEIQITDIDLVEEIIENVENALYTSRMVTEDTRDFTVTTPTSMIETITGTMETLSFFFIGIAAISLLVGAIGIANTMFMSVMERTRLIGILKALGTKNSEIMKLFITESGVIGFMGGLLGVFLGFILVGIISGAGLNLMGMGRTATATSTSIAVITPELIIFALIFSTVIGIISGLIPARKAASLQIVEAMRSE
jgi:putative ABC transport system permease protein